MILRGRKSNIVLEPTILATPQAQLLQRWGFDRRAAAELEEVALIKGDPELTEKVREYINKGFYVVDGFGLTSSPEEAATKQKLSPRHLPRDLMDRGFKLEFNPPHASHFGGSWERKMRQIRRASFD
ncbi:hypothetical protein HAZT_HAZT007806, partial [Hyalella azteca]